MLCRHAAQGPPAPRSSALMLFLELALIRWTGANIVHLGYFSNFVLLGSFLGDRARLPAGGRPHRDRACRCTRRSPLLRPGRLRDRASRSRSTGPAARPDLLHQRCARPGRRSGSTLPVVFIAVAGVMAGPGELVGSLLRRAAAAGGLPARPARQPGRHRRVHRRCRSCGAPPLVLVSRSSRAAASSSCSAAGAVLGRSAACWSSLLAMFVLPAESHDTGVFWSPYYKVSTPQDDGIGGTPWSRVDGQRRAAPDG